MKKIFFGTLIFLNVSIFAMQLPVRVYDQEKTRKLKALRAKCDIYALPVEEVQKLILEGADPNATPGTSRKTLLCHFHEIKEYAETYQSFIHFLLESGTDPNKWEYFSPLHYACSYGHIITVRKLIEKKAQVDAKNCHGISPLKKAVEGGFPGVVQVLLENGAKNDIDFLDAGGDTPKSFAIENNHQKILDLFEKFQKKS